MKLPTIFRAWQIIGKVSPYLMHAEAVSRLFRSDSLPHRILHAAAHADYSSRVALEVATRRYADEWPEVESAFVLRLLPKYGRLIFDASLPDTEGRVCMWDFGGHLVSHIHARSAYTLRSPTPTGELIRVAVELVTAELSSARLYVDRDGLVADSDDFGGHVSEQARELIEDLRAELATGEPCRTVLLVGPPGSGKSTMARQIAEAFAETTVAVDGVALSSETCFNYIRPEESRGTGSEDVVSIVKHCGAQAVVVDDYDRRADEGQSLALIRDLRASARVVIFTANDRSALSGAECRPKRFDKIVYVAGLDRETARSIAPDLPESVREDAWSTLLAAYLHELAVLCRAGRVDPRLALQGLQERQRLAEGTNP
jgi:energy-coupling factor transporter ATP-binding protein EcfA2